MSKKMNYRWHKEGEFFVLESLDDENASLLMAGCNPDYGDQFVLRWNDKNIGIRTYDPVSGRMGTVIQIGDDYRFKIEIGDIGVRVHGTMRGPERASPYLFEDKAEQDQVLDLIRRFFTIVSFDPADIRNGTAWNEALFMEGLQNRIDQGRLIRGNKTYH